LSNAKSMQEQLDGIKEQLKWANDQLMAIQKTITELYKSQITVSGAIAQSQEERRGKRELASLYAGVLFGGLLGVIGNFFVSFWFQEPTQMNIIGLLTSGMFLTLTTAALGLLTRKYSRS